MPEDVRAAVVAELGADVVVDEPQSGGFSPGLASRIQLSDGRWWFVKAINADRNPQAPGLYRREIEIATALPPTVPAPRLRWSHDDGDWVVLVFECVAGRQPDEPWRLEQLQLVLAALGGMAAELTPSPIITVPTIAEDLSGNFRSWRRLAGGDAQAALLDADTRAELDVFAELESGWDAAAAGKTLLHADLRADNLLITPDGEVVVVDWPYAVTGAAWVDALLLLPSVAADNPDLDCETIWRGYEPARQADPDAVNAVLAAIAGDFTYQSLLPAPPNVPGLRAHQRAKGAAALAWLWSRLR
ncbi:aminoglycoside phosphotransferase family protein [Saccharopolyspora pogona]|uniref:aminoglycoside phosphotransferase family protein n=1 Tax=Saccharopolyspora pogona TaxID=333966 RepID=UPI001CC24CB5|nr:aminoglycoside phosphotransferase family protein [Saccharopolyspora pogona]